MQNIQKFDTNFKINTSLSKENVVIYDVCLPPFAVHGLMLSKNHKDRFRRMPLDVARKVSEGVQVFHTNTAGGRVCFSTDSTYIAIHAELDHIANMSHMPLSGSAGFDLYRIAGGEEEYVHSFIPPQNINVNKIYESEVLVENMGMQEYILNFPLYSDVVKLFIILNKDAVVQESCNRYINQKPVVYYGSSITQGGCASRPGNSYESIISRMYHYDYINLGFSGNAKGEAELAKYIASLPMSAFVFDYDFNAPDLEYLEKTHEKFFKIIRSKHPKLPIICVSKPYCKNKLDYERRNFIRANVERWRKEGDLKTYFVDGSSVKNLLQIGDGMVVDGTHPNDLGFWCIAQNLGKALYEALNELN